MTRVFAYRLVRDETTEEYVAFVSLDDSRAGFVMPRADWDAQGQPEEIDVVV